MTHHCTETALSRLLRRIETQARDITADMIEAEVIATGGTYIRPEGTTTHLFEVQLHGVTATGFSEAEAIRNWIKTATRHCHAQAHQTTQVM